MIYMIIKKFKLLIRINVSLIKPFVLGTLCCFGYVTNATAECYTGSHTFRNPIPVDIPPLEDLPIDAPIGTVLFSTTINTLQLCDTAYAKFNPDYPFDINRSDKHWLIFPSLENIDYGPSIIANVRKTIYPGIGIYWSNDTLGVIHSSATFNRGTSFDTSTNNPSSTSKLWYNKSIDYTFKLIKIGDIEPGQADFGYLSYDGYSVPSGGAITAGANGAVARFRLGTSKVTSSTCSITSAQVQDVKLGTWFMQDFSGIGSTTNPVPLGIELICGSNIRILGKIQGTADISQQGAIKLNDVEGTASGVAVQLVNQNNEPLTLNQKLNILTSVGTGNSYTIPWFARYIQTASNVTTGNADALATLTLTYE